MSQTVVVQAPGSTVVQSTQARTVVARTTDSVVVERESAPRTVVVTRGIPGPAGDASGALLVDNRLSEFNTPAAREQAQTNLGLGAVDPLAYYILAKA